MTDGLVIAELTGEAALEALGLEDHPLFPLDLLIIPICHFALVQVESKVQSAVGAGDRDAGGGVRVKVALLTPRRLFQQRFPAAPEFRIEAPLPDGRILAEPVEGLQTGLIVVHLIPIPNVEDPK